MNHTGSAEFYVVPWFLVKAKQKQGRGYLIKYKPILGDSATISLYDKPTGNGKQGKRD